MRYKLLVLTIYLLLLIGHCPQYPYYWPANGCSTRRGSDHHHLCPFPFLWFDFYPNHQADDETPYERSSVGQPSIIGPEAMPSGSFHEEPYDDTLVRRCIGGHVMPPKQSRAIRILKILPYFLALVFPIFWRDSLPTGRFARIWQIAAYIPTLTIAVINFVVLAAAVPWPITGGTVLAFAARYNYRRTHPAAQRSRLGETTAFLGFWTLPIAIGTSMVAIPLTIILR